MKRYAYGVDLGGTTIKIGLFYTSGEQVSRWEIPTRSKNHGKQLLPDIARAIQSNMQVYGLQPQMIEGIVGRSRCGRGCELCSTLCKS